MSIIKYHILRIISYPSTEGLIMANRCL